MTPDAAQHLVQAALWTAFWTALPLLVIAVVIGVVVNLVQIVTSLQDPGVAAVPRLIGFALGLALCLPWMTARLAAYTAKLLGELSRYAR